MIPTPLAISSIKMELISQLFPGMKLCVTQVSPHSLTDWDMVRDDGPILLRIIRWIASNRHLEFGTWKGYGACLVLENSPATVWTINLWDGEKKPAGMPAYSENEVQLGTGSFWQRLFKKNRGTIVQNVQTDAKNRIGMMIHQKKLNHRVNQVFCDSRQWDCSAYPAGFFDSIFIDGGHQADVVASDTRKALPLLRQGGVVLWHDFCLDKRVQEKFPHVQTVIQGVESMAGEIKKQGIQLFWINPSWLLLGIKGNAPIPSAKG